MEISKYQMQFQKHSVELDKISDDLEQDWRKHIAHLSNKINMILDALPSKYDDIDYITPNVKKEEQDYSKGLFKAQLSYKQPKDQKQQQIQKSQNQETDNAVNDLIYQFLGMELQKPDQVINNDTSFDGVLKISIFKDEYWAKLRRLRMYAHNKVF
eukprot:403350870